MKQDFEEKVLNDLAGGWIDATEFGSPYQHLVNRDGRERWRPLADPADRLPPEWRYGSPPKEVFLVEKTDLENPPPGKP